MDDRTQLLLTSEPLPLLIRMATPNSVAFFISAGVSMTEVWFIGQLGSTSLAAIALVFPLLMLTQTMSGGAMGGAVASSIARAVGASDKARAEQLVWHALVLACTGALLFLFAFVLLGDLFLKFLGGTGIVLEQATAYCLILFSGGVCIWFLGIVSAIFRGMGDMKFPAMVMILSAFIQVPLSGCLVLGAYGFPQLGVKGAAISAVTSGGIMSVLMLARLTRGNVPIRLRLETFGFKSALFKDILNVALPASLSPLLTVTTIISLTAMVGSFGEAALAGYGIGSRIEFLLIPLVFGLGAAMTSLVGMSVGADNIARAERIGWIGGTAAAAVSGVIGLVLALSPDFWIPVFTSNPEVHESAKQYIQIVGPCFAFQGLGLSLYFASQGAGAMLWPIVALVLRVVLAVGGASLLLVMTDIGREAIYYAAGLGMIIYGLLIATALKLGAWRRH